MYLRIVPIVARMLAAVPGIRIAVWVPLAVACAAPSAEAQVLPDGRDAPRDFQARIESQAARRLEGVPADLRRRLAERIARGADDREATAIDRRVLAGLNAPASRAASIEGYGRQAVVALSERWREVPAAAAPDWRRFGTAEAVAKAEALRLENDGQAPRLEVLDPAGLAGAGGGAAAGAAFPVALNGQPVLRGAGADNRFTLGGVAIDAPLAFGFPTFQSSMGAAMPFMYYADPVEGDEVGFQGVVALGSDDRSLCTGVMLDASHVLTAAHCACDTRIVGVRTGRTFFGAEATVDLDPAGTRFYSSTPPPFCEMRQPAGWPQDAWARGDLALMTLREPLGPPAALLADAPTSFPAIGIAHNAQLLAAGQVIVVGFGLTESGVSGEKRRAVIDIASRRCAEGDVDVDGNGAPAVFGCVAEAELVARSPILQSDSCFGDSGGPALVKLSDGRYWIVGITSRGVRAAPGSCGQGGIYALAVDAPVIEWLRGAVVGLLVADAGLTVADMAAVEPDFRRQ